MIPTPSKSTADTNEECRDLALKRLLADDDSARIALSQRLHKDVAGGLVVCTSISEMIRHEFARAGAAKEIDQLHQSLDTALRQVLGLVRETTDSQFPPVLKVFGLHAALQELARNMAPRFSGSLLLNITGDEPTISLPRRLGLYRVVEELMDRCIRSAATSWIEVTTQAPAQDEMNIFIDHDGRSDIWHTGEDDTALTIVRARCQLLKASFSISSSGLGDRTRVSISIIGTP